MESDKSCKSIVPIEYLKGGRESLGEEHAYVKGLALSYVEGAGRKTAFYSLMISMITIPLYCVKSLIVFIMQGSIVEELSTFDYLLIGAVKMELERKHGHKNIVILNFTLI